MKLPNDGRRTTPDYRTGLPQRVGNLNLSGGDALRITVTDDGPRIPTGGLSEVV